MSHAYTVEPKTHGKVILNTSYGEVEIELFSKEAPKACRNFVQLCLEGYYDDTIFHRLVKNFILQGGDKLQNGIGESIYGAPFENEYHSRLKFYKRGLIATAVGNDKNNSQFFITLEKTEQLNYKHTIFGKIGGDTMFNVLKMAELEIVDDGSERPRFPPKILHAEVLWNPFDDLKPRANKWRQVKRDEKPKVQAKKDLALLSFGDEAEEEQQVIVKKSQSSGVKKQPAVEAKNRQIEKTIDDVQQQEASTTTTTSTNTTTDEQQHQQQQNQVEKRISAMKHAVAEQEQKQKLGKSDNTAGKSYLLEQRNKYKTKSKGHGKTRDKDRESFALERINLFASKLKDGSDTSAEKQITNDDDNSASWKSHALHFEKAAPAGKRKERDSDDEEAQQTKKQKV